MKKYQAGGSTDDLIPPSMLPDKPGIPPGKGFGDDIPAKKPTKKKPESKKAPKKMAGGGYIRAADGCAMKGKTRGKFV
jgi:hypothetical protein